MRSQAGATRNAAAAQRHRALREVQDYVTRDLFQRILDSEEDHVDWLETQIELIDKVGVQNYLQSQMGELE